VSIVEGRGMRKRTVCFGSTIVVLLPLLVSASEYYKLSRIKRIDQDLYRSGKIVVETRFCYHYTYGEEAVLKYEGSGEYSGSKIIWEDDSSCDVKAIIAK
jgi:hypothetical protein